VSLARPGKNFTAVEREKKEKKENVACYLPPNIEIKRLERTGDEKKKENQTDRQLRHSDARFRGKERGKRRFRHCLPHKIPKKRKETG